MLGVFKKKPKIKSNNQYAVPNEVAEQIRGLGNSELVSKASVEYKNWHANEKLKKNDPDILKKKEDAKNIRKEILEDPVYMKLEEEFKAKKEELITEELATLQEELKNLNQPYTEDTKSFRGQFRVAMDEIAKRKDAGTLT